MHHPSDDRLRPSSVDNSSSCPAGTGTGILPYRPSLGAVAGFQPRSGKNERLRDHFLQKCFLVQSPLFLPSNEQAPWHVKCRNNEGGVFHFVRAAAGEAEITPERNAVRRQRRSSLHWPDKRADRLAFLHQQLEVIISDRPAESKKIVRWDVLGPSYGRIRTYKP